MKFIKDKADETMLEEAGESKEYEKYEIEDAAHTLTKAEEIKANKKLHGHAMDHLAKKSKHMSAAMKAMKKPGSLAELKKMAHESGKAAAEIEE